MLVSGKDAPRRRALARVWVSCGDESDDVEVEQETETECPRDVEAKWMGMMDDGVSPAEEMASLYSEHVFKLGNLFLNNFIEYFENGGPDAVGILGIIVRSKANCLRLVQFGIMTRMFRDVPMCFPALLQLIKGSRGSGRDYFVRQGGLALLAKFFEQPESREVVSSILFEVSQASAVVELDSILLPPDECDIEAECTYVQFFQQIFACEDVSIVARGLKSLGNLLRAHRFLPDGSPSVQFFKELFFARLPDFLGNETLRQEAVVLLLHFLPCGPEITMQTIDLLMPVVTDENEFNATYVLLYIEQAIARYGLSIITEDKIQPILERCKSGSYDLKLQGMWVISEVVRHSNTELHRALIGDGILHFITDILHGTCCHETLQRTVETLILLIDSVSMGGGLTDDLISTLEDTRTPLSAIIASAPGTIAYNAKQAMDRIEALLAPNT